MNTSNGLFSDIIFSLALDDKGRIWSTSEVGINITDDNLNIIESLNQNISLVDMRFVKPIDTALLTRLSKTHSKFITLEDNAIMGGAGSAVSEFVSLSNLAVQVKHLGIPDAYIEHGSQAQQWAEMGIDANGIQSILMANE